MLVSGPGDLWSLILCPQKLKTVHLNLEVLPTNILIFATCIHHFLNRSWTGSTHDVNHNPRILVESCSTLIYLCRSKKRILTVKPPKRTLFQKEAFNTMINIIRDINPCDRQKQEDENRKHDHTDDLRVSQLIGVNHDESCTVDENFGTHITHRYQLGSAL